MHFSSLRGAFAVLLIAYFSADVAAILGGDLETHRLLRAATKRTDLYRRGVRITKRFESELAYVDNENVWNDESTFASQVKVSGQRPLLNLEEHEHHIKDVQCGDDTMKLHFVDTSSARDARAACHDADGGLIITSHEGCNDEGERSVYRVNDVSFAQDGEALELSVSKTTWRAAFDHVDISFGHTTDDHIYRRHSDFARIRNKRQNKVDIPADTPDDVNTVSFDLSSELLNTTFPVEAFLSGIAGLVGAPDVPLPIEIGCKRCATSGQIALSQGAFNIDLSQIDLIPDIFEGGDDGKEISHVISGGFVELVATGVGATLDLFARPPSSGKFEIALFQLPIAGFTIPGIGKAGAIFEPRLAFDFEISGTLEVNYGLQLTVPDGSSIRVELADLASSRVTGFQETSLTPLPVNVNITDAEILLGLAFVPAIPIGFDFLDQLKAEVTPSLNLPRLDAKLSSNIPKNCGAGNSSNATQPGAPFANQTADFPPELLSLGPLALVEANVSLSIDIALDVSIPILPPPFNAVGVQENIFTAVFPLLSGCAAPENAFDNVTGVIVPPPPPMMVEATSAPPKLEANMTAAPKLEANMTSLFSATVSGTPIADTTAKTTASIASEMAAAPTLMPNVTFIFASDVVSSSAESIATSTPMSSAMSTTLLLNTTSTAMSSIVSTTAVLNSTSAVASSTAYATSLLNTTSTMASEVVSTPCTTSLLNSTSTLISYVVSTTSSAATTTAPAIEYTPSATSSLNDTTTLAESTSTVEATSTAYVTSKVTAEITVTASASASSAAEAASSAALTSEAATSNATSVASSTANQSSAVVPASSMESTVESATQASSSLPSSSFIPTFNISSSASPASSALSSAFETSLVISSSVASTTPVASAPAVATENLPPPAPVVTMAAGFLVPSNASAAPVQQTAPLEFTGAAARHAPEVRGMLGWLMGVVGFCLIGSLF
ncbi:hypothetical protein J4E93_006393 [Alternaria ventricosa]|uniref:uncharacterized protein n=1 Tax=Alternaria ventricosa TaxID=1187951 RepID=UPI0020C34ABE|nr:uncharacterized protein J4E93_006393 [Alternaria ventricosa]KAI4644488.1 hypothetical protein J4E93_006393 [Alternaria ventricosa]